MAHDQEYHRSREEMELKQAQNAASVPIRRLHEELAKFHHRAAGQNVIKLNVITEQ